MLKKKMISVLLALAMVLGMSVPAMAAESDSLSDSDFTITERIDAKHRIHRVYQNDPTSSIALKAKKDNNFGKTKEILTVLGLDPDIVDSFSPETLRIYAESPKIITTTTYSKIDEEGHVTYLEEDVALAEASQLQKTQMENAMRGISLQSGTDATTAQNAYRKIVVAIVDMRNGKFAFSADATWLTMPSIRRTDSVGVCAMNATVDPSTRKGVYFYDKNTVTSGNITTETIRGELGSSKYQNAVNGNWYGSAGIFQLPMDINNEDSSPSVDYSILYTNYKAHYEYEGHVNYPDMESYFNVVGTHDHVTVGFFFTPPEISINLSSGDISASIGFGVRGKTESLSAELEAHYVP